MFSFIFRTICRNHFAIKFFDYYSNCLPLQRSIYHIIISDKNNLLPNNLILRIPTKINKICHETI
jgi:hypothetical protein